MTDDCKDKIIHGDEAEDIRQMYREWQLFKSTDKDTLSKLVWVISNWKLFALAAIMGAAGTLKNFLEMLKEWLS